jgi:hypothetical protein
VAESAPIATETALGERRQVDCVEIYLPKSLEFLSELYRFLRDKISNRFGLVVLDGFSVYEVDGVFYGEKLYEQRTLVIRVMFIRPVGSAPELLSGRLSDLGWEVANTVAVNEEQIWICRYPQDLFVFTGLKQAQK